MANDIICEISSAGEIVVEINAMTYWMPNEELALKADKTYVDNQDLLKADKATTYTKTEVDTGLGLKANKQREAGITATLLNGWTGTLKFSKNDLGIVNLFSTADLTIGTKTAGTTIATLPVGYRPYGSVSLNAISATGASKAITGIYVNVVGSVSIREPFASEAITGNLLSINAIYQAV